VDGRVLADLVREPIIGTDGTGRIVLWNRAATAAYGFARAEAMGERAVDLLGTEIPLPLTEIDKALETTGRWAGRLVHRAKNGRHVRVESEWFAHYGSDGAIIGAFAIDRDLAVASEAAAERRNARLEPADHFVDGIAHDFNNTLAVITNFTAFVAGELRRIGAVDGQERWSSLQREVEEIEVAAAHGARLTQQLLALSRLDAARPVAIDLNETIRGSEDMLQRTVGDGIRLTTRLADDLGAIYADPGHLRQLLVDLAANSRDAMPDGGTLTIETDAVELGAEHAARFGLPPGIYSQVRVSDTGEGMEPDVLARAFEASFTTKPVGRGTGLGLTSVTKIVAGLGGSAHLTSTPGAGTTFTALFPTCEVAGLPLAPAARPASPVILLVEDQDTASSAAERILAAGGYRVVAAASGPEALAVAQAHAGSIDLLVTDVVMPEMSGQQLADRLRALRPDLPVLYMSGLSEAFLGQAVGADHADVIEKPFDAVALLARVDRALAVAP
jgi:PAS domain S-box-containing protein